MRQPGPSVRRPLPLILLLPFLAAAASAAIPSPSPSPSLAVEAAVIPGSPAGVAACRCCPAQYPRRSRCFRASCRVQSCLPEKCAGSQRCLTPVPPALPSPSPSPSVRKRQVSLNWQPLTLQEARALLRRLRPRGPGGRALLRRRPPQRAPAGQTQAQHPTPGHSSL
ncbi:hypothetical protein HJG60_012478 [Phyllostomus discolor]|uniref:Uncharacterized protein n=1 Tax=Phyllostomus discolor TaxID=89673 RepID=A0A834DFA9_9CHIR|nr:hypothetical protein HJG60_012478 [Phyllostomus discolor]